MEQTYNNKYTKIKDKQEKGKRYIENKTKEGEKT